jgi:hypothetical protein
MFDFDQTITSQIWAPTPAQTALVLQLLLLLVLLPPALAAAGSRQVSAALLAVWLAGAAALLLVSVRLQELPHQQRRQRPRQTYAAVVT